MFAKYLNNGPREYVFQVSNLSSGSAIWNFLCKCRSVILPHLSWIVHNGRKVRFWEEFWNGHPPLVNSRDLTPLISTLSSLWGVFVANYFEIEYSGNLKVAKWKSIEFLDIDQNVKLEYENMLGERVIILSDANDELIQTRNISGKYTIKDGYNYLLVAKDLSTWPYKFFWHMACLLKAGDFAWLAVQDRVLTGMRLDRLGITAVFSCVFCNKNLESSKHLFLHCDFAYACQQWLFEKLNRSFVIGKDLLSHFRAWPLLFASSFYACLWIISPSIVIWNIWLERNNRIFKQTSSSLAEVLLRIESSIFEVALSFIYKNLETLTSFSHWDGRVTRVWRMLSVLPSHGSILNKTNAISKRDFSCQKPPPQGHFKLNFDGASRGNPGLAGVVMVIYDHKVRIVQARCHVIGFKSNNCAKFFALSFGLDMAISLGIKDLIIEGDSMVIIQSVMKKKSNCWKLQYILDHILQKLDFFDSFFISHYYREVNKIADCLANLAIDSEANIWEVSVDKIPSSVLEYLK